MSSWIVTRRETGEAVCELYSRKLVDAVNCERYEVQTALDYLIRLNAQIKKGSDQ